MSYQLGIDLGTTFTTAAVARRGRSRVLAIGARTTSLPTVVATTAGGAIVVGEAAQLAGLEQPELLAPEVKRRLRDPAPIVTAAGTFAPAALAGVVLADVVRRATDAMLEPPSDVVVTHSASDSPAQIELSRVAAQGAGLGSAVLLSEAEAAVEEFVSEHRAEPDEVVLVYDLGGGSLDVALVCVGSDGLELMGEPESLERFGGVDIDALLMGLVCDRVPATGEGDPDDPEWRRANAHLREAVRGAKEQLSMAVAATVPVITPLGRTEVTVTRADLERLVLPRLDDTVHVVERTVSSAGLNMPDVTRVLLVGGSSRIPLVRQVIADATGRPVAMGTEPENAVALGAALHSIGSGRPRRFRRR